MSKVTLEAISQGKSGTGKNGKPYQMIGLKVKEYPDTWINGFGNSTTKTWQKGDVVDVEVYDEEYQGKTFKKFKMGKVDTSTLEPRIKKLEDQMAFMAKKMGFGDTQALPAIEKDDADIF